jgi:hypothetical protein
MSTLCWSLAHFGTPSHCQVAAHIQPRSPDEGKIVADVIWHQRISIKLMSDLS